MLSRTLSVHVFAGRGACMQARTVPGRQQSRWRSAGHSSVLAASSSETALQTAFPLSSFSIAATGPQLPPAYPFLRQGSSRDGAHSSACSNSISTGGKPAAHGRDIMASQCTQHGQHDPSPSGLQFAWLGSTPGHEQIAYKWSHFMSHTAQCGSPLQALSDALRQAAAPVCAAAAQLVTAAFASVPTEAQHAQRTAPALASVSLSSSQPQGGSWSLLQFSTKASAAGGAGTLATVMKGGMPDVTGKWVKVGADDGPCLYWVNERHMQRVLSQAWMTGEGIGLWVCEVCDVCTRANMVGDAADAVSACGCCGFSILRSAH